MSGADGSDEDAARRSGGNVIVRGVAGFGRFWWDFLIGDTPELFVATLAVIALAELFHHHGAIGVVVVIAAVLAFLVASVLRGRTSK